MGFQGWDEPAEDMPAGCNAICPCCDEPHFTDGDAAAECAECVERFSPCVRCAPDPGALEDVDRVCESCLEEADRVAAAVSSTPLADRWRLGDVL
ncbi:MAG: hypothetical protein RID81_07270 [Sandaracinaceae bacterium]